jgi:hypothetical protein
MSRARDTADQINRINSSAADATAITVDSSENVGIGTSSPNKISGHTMLSVNTATATQYAGVDISTADAVRSALYANNGGTYLETRASIPLILGTNTTERMRLDGSGQLLLGTTTSDSTLSVDIQNTSASSNNTLVRIKNNVANEDVGLIIDGTNSNQQQIYKIGLNTFANTSDLTFTGGTGYRFYTGSSERMRILSSGGITFNGDTAAANALDDYEEGTWTPLAKGTSTNPSSAPTLIGRYTKIGNQVNIYIKFDAVSFAGASGGVYFDGLPFSASGATVHGIGSVMQYNVCTFNDSPCLYVSGSAVYIYYNVSGGTWDNAQHTGSSAVYMNACATYTTNS